MTVDNRPAPTETYEAERINLPRAIRRLLVLHAGRSADAPPRRC